MILDDYVEGLELTPDDELLNDDPIDDNTPDDGDSDPQPIAQDEPPTVDDDDPEPDSDPDAVAYFNYLKEYNIIDVPEDFEFDGSVEGINQALEITKQSQYQQIASNIWNNLPEDFRPLLAYGLNGGTSLQAYLEAYSPMDYDSMDVDDPISQQRVIKEYYKTINPKYSEEKIDKMISRLMEIGDPKEEAEDALNYLKTLKTERQQNLLASLEAEREAQAKAAEEESKRLTELIDSSKTYDSLRKGRLKNFILNPIKVDNRMTTEFSRSLDEILENPEHLIQLADILADYDSRKGFNFERLKKQLKTDSVKNFKDLLQSKLDTKTKVKGGTQKETREDFDWDKFLST